MHGTSRPPMRNPGARAVTGSRFEDRVLWAALVPLLLLLRPYEGLIQDARIYIGSALADRDPLGIGRDPMFSAEGQTDFTILKPAIKALLGLLAPSSVSIVLALLGSLVWLAAVVVLCRCLARGRTAWAAAVCILAISPDYGAFGTFVYGESVVTPRVFAEAAVIGAMAGLLSGRRLLPLVLLLAAAALHPLMALAGIAVAALMLAAEDRRWLLPIVGGAIAVLAAAMLKLPLVDRLFEPMDAAWLAILRARSVNLFPSLWSMDVFAHVASRAAAAIVAATFAPPRLRALLLAALAVGLGGLALTVVLGDWIPLVLVTQLQTWRALWLLALLGNASIALSAVGLWRGGPAARLTLALLVMAWLSVSSPALQIGLAAATVALRVADARGLLGNVSPRIGRIAFALALIAAAIDVVTSGVALAVYLHAAWVQGGEALYPAMLQSGIQHVPLVFCAVALAIRSAGPGPADASPARPTAWARTASGVGLAAACVAGWFAYHGVASEAALIDVGPEATRDLLRLIGPAPGSLLWLDDFNETWFLAKRPAYFNATQGCPILFSRPLAFAWQERGRALIGKGLARRADLMPWTAVGEPRAELTVSRASVEAVCRAPDHPVAIVAPGDYRDAAPAGWPAGLWHPPAPVQYLSGDAAGLHWRKVESYTVIQCRPAAGVASSSESGRTASGRAGG